MTLLGTEVIYASHLPMFHSPHDYQIILVLELDSADQKIYMNDKKDHPAENLYTIEPENFVLPEMVNYIKKFKASIYRGHFERGGVKFMENVPVKIKQIVYQQHFDPAAKKDKNLQYILFGNRKEQFMVHHISARPDFDENISVELHNSKVWKAIESKGYVTIEFPETNLRKPFSWKQNTGFLKNSRQPVVFKKRQVSYLEFGDLN